MKRKRIKIKAERVHLEKNEDIDFPGYPSYPENEDAYAIWKEEQEINPADTEEKKASNRDLEEEEGIDSEEKLIGEGMEVAGTEAQTESVIGKEEKEDTEDMDEPLTGADLDVPGSELDDQQEDIGSEDEENNYYSIGGDKHNDLDESTRG